MITINLGPFKRLTEWHEAEVEDLYLYYVLFGDVQPQLNPLGQQENTSQTVTLAVAQASGLPYWPTIGGMYAVTSPVWYYKQAGCLVKVRGSHKAQALSLFIDVNGVQVPNPNNSLSLRFAYFNYGPNAYWTNSATGAASINNGPDFIFLPSQKIIFNTYKPIEQYKAEILDTLMSQQSNGGNGFVYKTLLPDQNGIVKHDLSRTNVSGYTYYLVKCEPIPVGHYADKKAYVNSLRPSL